MASTETRTADDYFAVGMDLMAAGGASSVTITALCERLDVTKGSFYYHFRNGEDYLHRLLDHWEVEHAHRPGRTAMSIEDLQDRLSVFREMAVGLRHDAESAIRALARTDAYAAEVLERTDLARIKMTRRTLVQLGLDEATAVRLSRMVVAMLVGMQQLRNVISDEEMDDVFRSYQLVVDAALAQPRRPTSVPGY